jgi:hypothetical protein
MVRQWQRGAIVLGMIGAAALAGAQAGLPVSADTRAFEAKTQLAQSTMASIATRIGDIEQLLRQANQEGKAIKASCIDEKLRRARTNKDAASTVMEGWSIGVGNAAYAQRQLDRMLLLQVYSMVYAEEARACTDAKAAGNSLQVEITKDIPEAPKQEPNRPPRFDRPPLASPY